jgi:two-component sensor histidine kinase
MEGKRFFTGIMRDITQRRQAEAHIQFVMRELSHRTKNLLAVVQSMAWQTARTSIDLKDFGEHFAHRIQALACSHDLLIKGEWQGVRLEDLVRGQLQLFGAEGQLNAHGHDLMLRPEAAQSLGLALHELATNASKYGALTRPAGRIEVGWSLDQEDAASGQFQMCWRECGGPEVSPPKRNGFGHTVIKDMTGRALRGEVALKFPPEGFVWQLTAPAIACLINPP